MQEDKRNLEVTINFTSPTCFTSLHCFYMSSTNDQPCFHIILVPMSDNECTMHEDEERYASSTSEAGLPDWAQATARIFPHSALAALATHSNNAAAP